MLKNTGTTVRREADPELVPLFFLSFILTPVLTPAGDLRPRPPDHGCLQTRERRAGVLRARGLWMHHSWTDLLKCWKPSQFALVAGNKGEISPTVLGGFIIRLTVHATACGSDLHIACSSGPLRVQWPLLGLWFDGCGTTWALLNPQQR